jgi:type VI secretion system protein ImpL
MKTLLKFLLITFVWLLIGAVVIGGTHLLEKPLSLGLTIWGALFATWLLIIVIAKLVIRYRAKQRVQNLIRVEDPPIGDAQSLGAAEAQKYTLPKSGPFDQRFKSVIKYLQKSRLRDNGDPLYVLPWYIMLGRPGCGKTTALKQARLVGPTADHTLLDSSGQSCDWWLYNQAIMIDTPGAYITGTSGVMNAEWQRLLSLLGKYRYKEPLNGIVVTISLQRILSCDADQLFEEGRQDRRRLDELMQTLRLQVPVYVVVSQCDRLEGMSDWISALPRESLHQAMGQSNRTSEVARSFVFQTLNTLTERMKSLMLIVLNQGHVTPALLQLPTRLNGLSANIAAYTEGLFQSNAFQEAPLFRGLYFMATHHAANGEADHVRGVFSHDFFTEILPKDRRMISTLTSAERAERWVRRAALSGWGIAVTALLTILISSFATHRDYLHSLTEQYAGQLSSQPQIASNITSLSRLRDMILDVESETGSWLIPWFGMPPDRSFANKLRETFLSRMQEDVLSDVDSRMQKNVDVFMSQMIAAQKPATPPRTVTTTKKAEKAKNNKRAKKSEKPSVQKSEPVVAQTPAPKKLDVSRYIEPMVRRINLLNAFMNGASFDDLAAMPPAYDAADAYLEGELDTDTVATLNELLLQRLQWLTDKTSVAQELEKHRGLLAKLLKVGGQNLEWMIGWANQAGRGEEIKLADFWPGSGEVHGNDAHVPAAYTLAGKALIDGFLAELLKADQGSEALTKLRDDFLTKYHTQYLRQWERFAGSFNRGTETLNSREEWLIAVQDLAGRRNPYFQALNVTFEQIEPLLKQEDLPDWASLVSYYQDILALSGEGGADNGKRNQVLTGIGLKLVAKAGPAGKMVAGMAKSGMKTKKQLDSSGGKGPDERQAALEDAAKVWADYRKALEDVAFNSESRSVSYTAAASRFTNPDNPGAGETPDARAYQLVKQLERLVGVRNQRNQAFWELYAGPLTLIQRFEISEAACYLQDLWENKFLTAIEGVPDYKLPSLMYGAGGKLWQFLDAEARPFVSQRFGSGYVANRVGDTALPIRTEFLEFASRGRDGVQEKLDSYPVSITAKPTSVNPEAQALPQKTVLQLECTDRTDEIINFNFPAGATFNWSDACRNTKVSIDVGGLLLEKRFEGPDGFARFIAEFRGGAKRLQITDFPEFSEKLSAIGVKYIDVHYQFKGEEPLLTSASTVPLIAPMQIADCWGH